jgi:hypothetical protein
MDRSTKRIFAIIFLLGLGGWCVDRGLNHGYVYTLNPAYGGLPAQ